MRLIANSPDQDTTWTNEIESGNLVKKGQYKVGWVVDGTTIYIESTSAFDVSGTIYIATLRETVATGVTSTPLYISFNGTSWATTSTDILTGSWDGVKNGFYNGTARIVGYWDGDFYVEEINSKVGKQI